MNKNSLPLIELALGFALAISLGTRYFLLHLRSNERNGCLFFRQYHENDQVLSVSDADPSPGSRLIPGFLNKIYLDKGFLLMQTRP
jgi:hypothetical protein